MESDKLKQELFYMARLTSKYDFSKMEVVEGILRLENERSILDSVFGCRFKTRIFDIAAGVETDEKCVLCGNHADNKVICNHCMETILGSGYAKDKLPDAKTKSRINFRFPHIALSKIEFKHLAVKTVLKGLLLICLILILIIQIWILSVWHSLPTYNAKEQPEISSYEPEAVNSVEEATSALAKDFPAEEGYTIQFAREDTQYVGRFLLENGTCCEEAEEQLTDEKRYDYFFTEEVYVFYISLNEEYTAKVGMAEMNRSGSVIILGEFNDGRRTDCFYKYR